MKYMKCLGPSRYHGTFYKMISINSMAIITTSKVRPRGRGLPMKSADNIGMSCRQEETVHPPPQLTI